MARQRVVVDASAFISAFIQDRRNDVQEALISYELTAPGNFAMEVAAMLLRKQRQRKADSTETTLALNALQSLNVVTYQPQTFLIIETALQHSLTAYDAAYLAASIELNAPIVTKDKALASAARSHGLLWSHHSGEKLDVSFILEPLVS